MSIDAVGTQTKIADIILKKSADYLLSVKDNQPTLAAEVSAQFHAFWASTPKDIAGPSFCEQFNNQHGRRKHRRYWQFPVGEQMPICQKWKAKTIIAVQSERTEKRRGHDFVRFYISSQPMNAEKALQATRSRESFTLVT
ncbi:hypothetical protein VY86_04285 [Photorhabdus thracensis]|uniref:Transposase n=1 Tax=Photorhabdus thracensis TaxID=230089 RepID=A0A0F7LLB4_9GAMM|nr:hypothetical protein VY86_04285 [Photorhabdus thracensis]